MSLFFDKNTKVSKSFEFAGEKIEYFRFPLSEARHAAYRSIQQRQLKAYDLEHIEYKTDAEGNVLLNPNGEKIISRCPVRDFDLLAKTNEEIKRWTAEQIFSISGVDRYEPGFFFVGIRFDLVDEFVKQLSPDVEEEVKNSKGEPKE